jgi:hypothetical protein
MLPQLYGRPERINLPLGCLLFHALETTLCVHLLVSSAAGKTLNPVILRTVHLFFRRQN